MKEVSLFDFVLVNDLTSKGGLLSDTNIQVAPEKHSFEQGIEDQPAVSSKAFQHGMGAR